MHVRRTDLEIVYENVAQALVIILAGMNGDMLAMLVEHLHYQTEPNDLRPRAEDRHYFHNC